MPFLPPEASLAAEWLEPSHSEAGKTVYTNRRDLSAAEKAELNWYIKKNKQNCWATGVSISLVNGGHYMLGTSSAASGYPLIVVALSALSIWSIAKGMQRISQIRKDIAAGNVVLVQIKNTDVEKESASGIQPVREVLIHTRLVWSEAGQPAPWRGKPPIS